MRLLVSGASATISRYPNSEYLGHLLVPRAGNSLRWILSTGLPWAVDNDAFSGFDPAAFCALVSRVAQKECCRFVACPDVVGDAPATMVKFFRWQPVLKEMGLPVALVAQDGLEFLDVPWERFEALFIGGTTEWKLGPAAAELIRQAKERGCWVHMGRCSSRKRFRYAYSLDCDSVDGSAFSRWPGRRIPEAIRWLEQIHGKPRSQELNRDWIPVERARGKALLGQGWRVRSVERKAGIVRYRVDYLPEPLTCPCCGVSTLADGTVYRHGFRYREVEDLAHEGKRSLLCINQRRYRCRSCGSTFLQPLPGIDGRSRTERLRCGG